MRGGRTRFKFSQDIEQKTGLWISGEMIQRVETGAVQCHISKTLLGLMGYDISLADLILPQNILEGIRNPVCKEGNGEMDSPPV
jgi:hypothetical protein